MWSSKGLLPYISYTIHWVDDERNYKTQCLETFYLPSDHTAANIADALKDIRQTWKLPEEGQMAITTDNAANMICATNILKWQRLSCFGHNLNLAVTNSLKDDNRVSRALGVAHRIVSAFSTSWKRRQDLSIVQIEKKLPQHMLIAHCPTRWKSKAKMISRLLEQENAIRAVLGLDRDASHLLPTWQDIHVWESLAAALSPLEDLTDFLSGDTHVTVSSVIPVLFNLANKILKENQDDNTLTRNIKKYIIDYMEKKYAYIKTKEILNIVTFLDPRARETKESEEFDVHAMNNGIAFAELVSYIEEARKDNLVASVFKLADLANLYNVKLKQLGTDTEGCIHSTKLKDGILGYFQDMEAHRQGRDVMLVSKKDVGSALNKACKHDADNDPIHLARAANIVRRDMFKMKNQFNGSFESKCQEESVPVSLLALVAMVLNGPNIAAQSSSATMPQSVLTISQLLVYNSMVRHCKDVTSTTGHSKERKTPLPIYLGVMIHTKTRKRELVDDLFELGISVSYDRVLEISADLSSNVCQQYMRAKIVCIPKLKCGLFTTAAVDNIDQNPSSTSAQDSFHATGISLFQHTSDDLCGFAQNIATENTDSRKETIAHLPEAYTNITPIAGFKHNLFVPKLKGPSKANIQLIPQGIQVCVSFHILCIPLNHLRTFYL